MRVDAYDTCRWAYRGGCSGAIGPVWNPYTSKPWGAMCETHYAARLVAEERTLKAAVVAARGEVARDGR